MSDIAPKQPPAPRDLLASRLPLDPCSSFGKEWWHGRILGWNGESAEPFTAADVVEIIRSADDGAKWDGECAAVFRLQDGRYAAYESWWGPTGDGFHEDAYGGDSNIVTGADEETVVRFGLTAKGRDLLGYPREMPDRRKEGA